MVKRFHAIQKCTGWAKSLATNFEPWALSKQPTESIYAGRKPTNIGHHTRAIWGKDIVCGIYWEKCMVKLIEDHKEVTEARTKKALSRHFGSHRKICKIVLWKKLLLVVVILSERYTSIYVLKEDEETFPTVQTKFYLVAKK